MSSELIAIPDFAVELDTLQGILDIVEDPNESYPEQAVAQDFFEVHWGMFERLAAKATELGLRPTWEEEDSE